MPDAITGKSVLLCRDVHGGQKFSEAVIQAGGTTDFFPTFVTRPVKYGLRQKALSAIRQLDSFDAIVLSSWRTIRHLSTIFQAAGISLETLTQRTIGVVGRRVVLELERTLPEIDITVKGASLQDLMSQLASDQYATIKRVIHLTSKQSVTYVKPSIPDSIDLTRVPIYESVINDELSGLEVGRVRVRHYDAVVFGSPSAFEYYIQLLEGPQHLNEAAVCVLGPTTQKHLQERGFDVDVVPEQPDDHALIEALNRYFETKTRKNYD